MNDAREIFGKLATTNQYQVFLGPFNGKFIAEMSQWGGQGLRESRIYAGNKLGLLCTDASIPASTYATAEVKDNYMGIPQEFAHTRLYTDIDFTFYIDKEYHLLSFFEFWMNYVGGASELAASSSSSHNVYRRFAWPDDYKIDNVFIQKFERDYNRPRSRKIQYQLINAFPKSVTSIPISYGPADLLKITVTMNYDRYLVTSWINPVDESSNNSQTQQPPAISPGAPTVKNKPISPTLRRQNPALTEKQLQDLANTGLR